MAERGVAAVEFALGFVVLLVPAVLLVMSFGPLLERRVLARTVAVETARTLALHRTVDESTVRSLFAGSSGVGADELGVAACGVVSGSLAPIEPCGAAAGEVEVRVTIGVPAGVLRFGPAAVSATHREPVDPFASRP